MVTFITGAFFVGLALIVIGLLGLDACNAADAAPTVTPNRPGDYDDFIERKRKGWC